ncbi:MAG: glycoside hydrolase family 9 protein [Armatimonadota bacterium]
MNRFDHFRRSLWASGALAIAAVTAAGPRAVQASDLVSVQPLTERILLLHFDDGRVEHHKRGAPRSDEKVIVDPLDTRAATRPATYGIVSADDPAYKQTQTPQGSVGRKTKGTEFAWITDRWENGRAVNDRPDHAAEHWIYLTLPAPMTPGKTYTIRTGTLAQNGREWKLTYSLAGSRSEAVHVNTLGYVPDAPAKFAYVYHWMGDQGSLDLKPRENRPFYLIDKKTGKKAFTGQVRFRTAKDSPETFHKSDSPPQGNFLGADVWECDFSAFKTPGAYVVAVEGVGGSWPFKIEADVYRAAFETVARGLYHNRSGIALVKPYTEFERPAPHHPKLTPGFAGKLRYTPVRWPEWGSEGGDAKKLMAESPGALEDTWGWYQDAGDWDSYYTHLRIAQELLLVYDMGPGKFTDGELNIPESGNGIPDILDEAAWLPRFCHRQRRELMAKGWGTGGVSLKVSGDAFGTDEGTLPDGKKVGRGSWEDTDRVWMVAGEDPWSTFRYAGAAACLAHAYKTAGVARDPEGIDWAKEAREAYDWAKKNTRPGDEQAMGNSLRHSRAYAAAALFRLTAEPSYEAQFASDTVGIKQDTLLWEDEKYGAFLYALSGKGDPSLLSRIRAAIVRTADESLVSTLEKRALRWGGNFSMPMLIGQQTTPWALEGAVAYTLTKGSEPERARRVRAGLYTTCDYFLGTNALNQTWVTGLGPRYPTEIFHMDAWYNGKGKMHPGLIPYGPWRKANDQGRGPWDQDWANKTLYPAIDSWPGNERWFSNRCAPLTSEFTVHQNIGPAAALFGFLCADHARR